MVEADREFLRDPSPPLLAIKSLAHTHTHSTLSDFCFIFFLFFYKILFRCRIAACGYEVFHEIVAQPENVFYASQRIVRVYISTQVFFLGGGGVSFFGVTKEK